MLAMVSMRPSCKPEIEHRFVVKKKKKRKLSKFGFVPPRSSGVIDEWKDEERSSSPAIHSSSDVRKRPRDASWEVSPAKAVSTIERTPVVEDVKSPPQATAPAPQNPSPNGSQKSADSDSSSCSSSSDESDTDEEEIMMWAHKMFGCPLRPPPSQLQKQQFEASPKPRPSTPSPVHIPPPPQTTIPRFESNADEEARARRKKAKKEKKERRKALEKSFDDALDAPEIIETNHHPIARKKKKQPFALPPLEECEKFDAEKGRRELEEERKKREAAKPLTMKQVREILGEDDFMEPCRENWVRRSVRRPCKALLSSKPVRSLVRKLKTNHKEMVVLKMKKYINDPDAPQVVIDAALDALEENTNCEALFIQNFNQGMRDSQVLHLLRILQLPSCKIWCLNIGETYNVDIETWEKFTKGLRNTKVTHMYASEHTITSEMKDEIRAIIRENRSKHDMHINPNNLDVIVQCTHCWWNPINAKRLRPYLKKQGYEHILNDKEAQGLKGSTSEAPTK